MDRRRFNKTGYVEITATYIAPAGTEFYVCSGDFDYTYIAEMYVDGVEVSPSNRVTATSDITTVELKIATGDLYCLFYGCNMLCSAVVRGSGVFDTNHMFSSCESLTSLDLSNFDTSNVTDMSGMFSSCESLTSLDLSNFDTSNVTDMSWMFSSCESLTSLDLSNFDTSNVTDMGYMFMWDESLTSLDLSNFNTSKVTKMSDMFFYCSLLTSLELSHFDTSNVTDMSGMFEKCSLLTSLELSHFDTSNVTDMSGMFEKCFLLTSLDLSNFDTSKVTDMYSMFRDCESLTSLDLSNFDTSNVTDMSWMFSSCESLTSLDLSNFNTSNVTDMSYMFSRSTRLREIIMRGDTTSTADMYDMFKNVSYSGTFYYNPTYDYSAIIAQLPPSGWEAVALNLTANWTVQSGTWNKYSDSNAVDGRSFTCVSPGDSGSTVIRCTFSGVISITFNCVYNGESSYDYLTVGNIDSSCTRYSYGTTLEGTSGTAKDITFTCDAGTHYVEFCYSKDGSVSTSPDNATVYIKSCQ